MQPIKITNEFLSAVEFQILLRYFKENVSFNFGWPSSDQVPGVLHWNKEFIPGHKHNQNNLEYLLLENPDYAPIVTLWNKLKETTLKNHALVRCYANAHTYGVEGAPHTDTKYVDNFTTIMYVVPDWKAQWGSETMFYTDTGEPSQAILPAPNRIFTFDGSQLHCAKSVSRICNTLRVTLMFKTRLENGTPS